MRGGVIVFRPFGKVCWPYKRMLGWALIALGLILLLTFVPLYIWLAIVGLVFVIVGVILSRC